MAGKAYFIADTHLGSQSAEETRNEERSLVKFLDKIEADASELYLMGDILDYWFEYKYAVPRGFVRFFGKLASMADKGIKITWLIGNHDIWIFDYLPSELGIEVYDGRIEREIDGVAFSLQHGDAVGGTKKFRFMRAMFRNRFLQWLYSGIHPRWTVGFAHGCSVRSRKHKTMAKHLPELKPELKSWCEDQIASGNGAKYFVFGHLHEESREKLPDGREMIVLPPWMGKHEYGVFDGNRFEILRELD